MPCDAVYIQDLRLREIREREIEAALEELERELVRQGVQCAIGQQGAVAFVGWEEPARASMTDVCAYRALEAKGSSALASAISTAEQLAGRTVDQSAIAAGWHSHDSGLTWSQH